MVNQWTSLKFCEFYSMKNEYIKPYRKKLSKLKEQGMPVLSFVRIMWVRTKHCRHVLRVQIGNSISSSSTWHQTLHSKPHWQSVLLQRWQAISCYAQCGLCAIGVLLEALSGGSNHGDEIGLVKCHPTRWSDQVEDSSSTVSLSHALPSIFVSGVNDILLIGRIWTDQGQTQTLD